jgi:hypothetical protein
MDWNQVIEQMGGGLSAVTIAALGFAVWRLAKLLLESYDARITREQEHARELMSTIETVRSLTRGGGE